MIADVRGTCLILNPGSVYRQRYESGPCRTCGLLSLPDMTFTVYDIDTEKTVTPECVRIRLSDR